MFQPWNEANSQSQPTAPWRTGAPAAARYYNVVKRFCRGCTVTAADLLDTSKRTLSRWLAQFRRYANGAPRLWGLHNYGDANRRSGMTAWFLRQVPGNVWLTETGGIVYFRDSKGTVRFRYDEARAAVAIKRCFDIARRERSRVKQLYLYQWSKDFPANRFDAGLVRDDGTPRPGYWVVRHYRSWIS